MLFILDIFAFVITVGASCAVGKTTLIWQGAYKQELKMITGGFVILAVGFLWRTFGNLGIVPLIGDTLVVLGVVPLAMGASTIFSFSPSSAAPQGAGSKIM